MEITESGNWFELSSVNLSFSHKGQRHGHELAAAAISKWAVAGEPAA
jgi:hypothetical protein